MGIKVGDKVKFLNATGGGVVRNIIDSRLVSVAIEGGFEIPVQASELLVIDPVDAGSRFFHESFDVPDAPEASAPSEHPEESQVDLPKNVINSRRSEDIFLVFVPHDQKWLITGHLDVFLVNNTSYDVLYNHFRKDERSWSGVDYGSLGAGTRLLIATIHRDELPLWTDGCLQFLFHKQRCNEVPPPFHADFSITGKKFYSEQNYRDSIYTAGKGIVVKIATISMETDEKNVRKPVSHPSGHEIVNSDDFILRHKTGDREAEVDLHIQELVDDPASFEKVEILEYQKNYFVRCLESAIAGGFLKIIFIHGVGNGVLKEVLLDILKKQEGIEVFDAPMQKYGVGAIEVHIRHNR
jgi:Domain of unknown function (DUF2027)